LEEDRLMCTVSWIRQAGGHRLFCNRDEKHTRRVALPPAVRERRGVRFIAPLDGAYGGTWIGVNQFGLSLCVLNRYQDEAVPSVEAEDYLSRGLLLVELIDCRTRSQTQSRIEQITLVHFQPFTLLILEPEQPSLLTHWTGRELLSEPDGESAMPLISSSHDLTGVSITRRRHFNSLLMESGRVDDHLLDKFHSSHFPTASAYSTCMHRNEARTVSFSKVNVSRDGIEFFYYADSPCASARADNRFETVMAPEAV
jgi:uncharacterized protein with NRDE domain